MSMETKRLILSLGEPQEPILWCWGDPAEEGCQRQGELCTGESLPEEIGASPAIVLIPGQHVVLRTAQFHGSARLAKAQTLAFQCEDELLEEVDELHWVILGHEGANYTLAGYRRTDMQNWLALLASLGIQPNIMLPDVLAFPYVGQPTQRVLRQYVLLRNDKWSGYCLPQRWRLGSLETHTQMPPIADAAALWQCASAEPDKNTTLLKGEFAPIPQWRATGSWRGWALSIGLALALSALALGNVQQEQQVKNLRQQMAQIHTQIFSGKKIPAKPLAAIKARIKILQRKQQQPQFFELAQQLRQALPEQHQNSAHQLKFDAANAELTLTLNTADVSPFNRFNEQGNQVSLQPIAGENSAILTVKETP